MRFRPTFARSARVALLWLVPTLLVSCAVPGGPTGGGGTPSRMSGVADDGSRGQLLYTLTVSELRGKAWLQRDGRPIGLKVGSEVAENVPLQVGGRSTLRLRLGDHAHFELAPNSRLVVHQLPHQGLGDARATWLRLEQGYLRIQWRGALMEPPMQVSFGIWAARLKPGEYFFDTRGRVAAACAASGSIRLSGVPEWTPQGEMQECLRLEANKAPLAIAMDDASWNAVRAQRRLHPTLARAARDQARAAIARLERNLVKSPGQRPAVPAEPAPPAAESPPLAVAPRTTVTPPQRTPIPTLPAPSRADDASRARTEGELIREAEDEVRKAARAKPVPAPPPPRAPDPAMPGPAASVALGPSPTIAPLPPMPAPRRAPAPVAPPPPPPPPPPPEPVYEAPPPLARHTPPVIVIPAEPEPEPAPMPPPPPPPPAPVDEPPIRVIEPPRAQHVPPVIVIPEQPEPPAPPPVPPPATPPPTPEPPPVVAVAPPPPPPPPPLPATPPSPPVITIPAEPEPQAIAPAPEPPVGPDATPPPIAGSALSASSIELAEQAPVVIPPPSQPPPPDSVRRPGSATPPSVPLDVAMYSVAAMPDRIGTSESALIVPPTITHDPARSQWLVNIASYPTIEPAQEHARLLVSQQLRAGVREQALPDRMSYVVVIEGFSTEEAAETAAIDLEAHFDLDPY